MAAAGSEPPSDLVLDTFKTVQTAHSNLSEEDRARLNCMTMSLATDFEKEIVQSLDRASLAYSPERFDNLRANIASRLFSMGPRVGHKRSRDVEIDDEVRAILSSLLCASRLFIYFSISYAYRSRRQSEDQLLT